MWRSSDGISRGRRRGPNVEIVAVTDHPDRQRPPQRAVAAYRGELQLFCCRDPVELLVRPCGHQGFTVISGGELGVPDLDPMLAMAEHLVRHDQRAHGAHEGERHKRGDCDCSRDEGE